MTKTHNSHIALTYNRVEGTKYTHISLSHLRSGSEHVVEVRTQFASEAISAIRELLEQFPRASFNYVPFMEKLNTLEFAFAY